MRLKFVNQTGSVEFDGFGSSYGSVISVSGLGVPQKKFGTVKYVDIPGQVTVSEEVLPREIVIKGDINLNGGMPLYKYHIFFSYQGVMHIFNRSGKKKIDYKVQNFKTDEKNGDFVKFELFLICDYPYFSDSSENETDLYKRIDKISGTFTLPAVFTERITEADIINKGQVKAEPVIEITCVNSGVFSGGITVLNQKNGKKLALLTSLSEGETITLDVKNRKISSTLRDNCYGILSERDVLSDFVLEKGINTISVQNLNNGETVKVKLKFDNMYVEAM